MNNLMKAFCVVLVLGTVLSLGACNTIDGIRKDASAVGKAITDAVQENKGY